jgi:hypothetical protein
MIQEADTPPHLISPDVLSAIHLSSQLSLWPLYREATVLLCHVMLNMEGAELAEKVKTQLSMVEDQVRIRRLIRSKYADPQVLASQDEELICLLEIALGEAEIEVELGEAGRGNDFGMSAFLAKMLMTDI